MAILELNLGLISFTEFWIKYFLKFLIYILYIMFKNLLYVFPLITYRAKIQCLDQPDT